MEDTESSGSRGSESSPTSSGGGGRRKPKKEEVFQEVLRRLKELDIEEAKRPGFEDELRAHFRRLPLRYAMDVNVARAEDVLMHKRLLHMARDPNTRLAFELRLVQVLPISDENPDDSVHSNLKNREDAQNFGCTYSFYPPPAFGLSSNFDLAFGANNRDVQDENSSIRGHLQLFRPSHEITISTNDKPKLLSQLTSLLSEIGLNIQEAHAFSTRDGYSLDVFIVDGWPFEKTDQLKNVLGEEIPKIENQSALKQKLESPGDGFGQNGINFISNHVDIPTAGDDVWEVDVNLLKFENKIATWSNFDLYKGTFFSQDVAVKVLKAEYLNEDARREFAQEVYILSKLRNKNIVQFIGACTRPPLLCIVTEFMHGGSVYDLLHKHDCVLKLPAIVKIAIDVSRGMSYLHQNNIIHRDLKAANLLMDENNVVKVADFGLARVQVESGIMTAETGTYRWMAPEIIGHRPYDHKADVFSFGIVLWELLTGKLPYEDMTPLQAAIGVVQKGLRPTIPSDTHPVVVDLLTRCWQQDSSLRPEFLEIVEILQHLAEEVGEEQTSDPSGKRRNLGKSLQILA